MTAMTRLKSLPDHVSKAVFPRATSSRRSIFASLTALNFRPWPRISQHHSSTQPHTPETEHFTIIPLPPHNHFQTSRPHNDVLPNLPSPYPILRRKLRLRSRHGRRRRLNRPACPVRLRRLQQQDPAGQGGYHPVHDVRASCALQGAHEEVCTHHGLRDGLRL